MTAHIHTGHGIDWKNLFDIGWRDILPQGIKQRLGYFHKKRRFFALLEKLFPQRVKRVDQQSPAPAELIETEALMQKGEVGTRARADWYFASGYQQASAVLSILSDHGFDFASLRSLLEFGCGSSRVLRHFRNISGLRVVGTDANPKPIAWGRRNLLESNFSKTIWSLLLFLMRNRSTSYTRCPSSPTFPSTGKVLGLRR